MKQNLSKLMESELDKAELVLAAKGISDEVQTMTEKVAKLQIDELMPLVDRLKEVFGHEMADQFNSSVDGTLSSLLDLLKQSKDSIENQANVLNGEGDLGMGYDDMNFDADPGMGGLGMGDNEFGTMEPDEFEGDAEFGGEGDIFGADDTMAGGDEPMGRAKRESKRIKGKRLAEMAIRMKMIEKKLKVLKQRA